MQEAPRTRVESDLAVYHPPWHQQWWSAALEAALPVFAAYPLREWGARVLPPEGLRGWPAFAGFAVAGLAALAVGLYGLLVWLRHLTGAQRLTAFTSFLGYLLLTGLAIFIVQSAELDYRPEVVRRFISSGVILEGVWRTVYLSVIAQALGILLGLLAALGRIAKNPLFNTVANAYIWFFRGTPLLVQLLFWFAALPQMIPAAVNITAFQAAIIGLSVNEGAYMSEIVRAGILSVDPGQVDAAKSLGMSYPLTMRRIVLPQAMRIIIPPTGNEFIAMLKSSSLASAITFEELFRRTQAQISTTFRSLELLTVASLWYLAMTTVFSILQLGLERHFSAGVRRDGGRRGLLATILRSLGGRGPT